MIAPPHIGLIPIYWQRMNTTTHRKNRVVPGLLGVNKDNQKETFTTKNHTITDRLYNFWIS